MLPFMGKTEKKEEVVQPPVGREREVEMFTKYLARLRLGQSQCHVITGEEGLGKSGLLRYFKQLAKEDGGFAFHTRANESVADNPYQPVFSAVGLGFNAAGEVVRSNYATDYSRELGMETMQRVVEVVNNISSVIPNPVGLAISLTDLAIKASRFNKRKQREQEESGGTSAVNKNFQAIHEFLFQMYEGRKGKSPIVLIIDEAQYGSETTFKLFDALVTPSFPILLLLGWDAMNAELPKTVRDLVQRTHGDITKLEPLPREQVQRLIDKFVNDDKYKAVAPLIDQHRDALAEFSSGVPGVVNDSINYLLEGGDPALFSNSLDAADDSAHGAQLVGALTSKYLDALDPDLRSVLECAAVLGRRFPLEVMTSTAMQDYLGLSSNRRSVMKRLAALAARKQVVSVDEADPQIYTFNSVYVYNSLLKDTPDSLRRADRLEVARAWEQLAEEQGSLAEVSGDLARYFYEAEYYAPASRYYMAAANKLFNETAYSEAIDAYTKVLDCLDRQPGTVESLAVRTEVLTTRSLAYEYLGKNNEAIGDLAGVIAIITANSAAVADDSDEEQPVGVRRPDLRRAELTGHLGWLYFKVSNYGKAAACFDTCEAIYKAADDLPGLVRVGVYRGTMLSQQRKYEEAIKELEACLSLYEQHGIAGAAVISSDINEQQMREAEELDRVYLELGLVNNRMRRLDKAEEYLRRALQIAELQNDRPSVVQGKHYLGQCLSLQGKEEAIHYLTEAESEARQQLKDVYLATSIGNTLAYAYQNLGHGIEAAATFQRLIPELEGLGDSYGLGAAYGGLGGLYAKMWRLDEALEYLQRDLDLVNSDEHPSPSLVSKLANQIGDLQRLRGDRDQAQRNVELARAAAAMSDGAARTTSEGFVALTEARLHADAGDVEQAVTALAEAQEKIGTIPAVRTALTVVAGQLARLRQDWQAAYTTLTAAIQSRKPEDDAYDITMLGLELTRLARDAGQPQVAQQWAGWTAEQARTFGNDSLAALAAHEAA